MKGMSRISWKRNRLFTAQINHLMINLSSVHSSLLEGRYHSSGLKILIHLMLSQTSFVSPQLIICSIEINGCKVSGYKKTLRRIVRRIFLPTSLHKFNLGQKYERVDCFRSICLRYKWHLEQRSPKTHEGLVWTLWHENSKEGERFSMVPAWTCQATYKEDGNILLH